MGDGKGRRKSGPSTAAGKAAVRLNPLRHGVLAQTPVIPLVEREEDWVRLRDGIFDSFEPVGMMEEVLSELIATIIWRRCRVLRMETEAIAAYLADVPEDFRRMRASAPVDQTPEEAVAQMDRMLSARLMPGAETAEKIMRYETRLHRFLLQTIHQLLVLQALRKGGNAPDSSTSTMRPHRPRRLRPTETSTGGLVGLTAKRADLSEMRALVEGDDAEGEAQARWEAEGRGVLRGWDALGCRPNRAQRRRRERGRRRRRG